MQVTHPQLDYTLDPAALDQAFAALISAADTPLSQDAAWRRAATLNPLLSDGHLSILAAQWRTGARDYLQKGGRLFPYEVGVTAGGAVVIVSALGGAPTPLAGREIASINGLPASTVAAELLARTHGDTPVFRAALLSRRWWWYYWKRYGAPRQFTIRIVAESHEIAVSASTAEPVALHEASFDDTYRLHFPTASVAVLTVKSFYWEDKKRYYALMEDAFRRIRRAGATHLIIDVRDNGGGDDDMWMRGILKYIASAPYKTGSSYIKRVIEGRRNAGETPGDAIAGHIETVTQPEMQHPQFFHGKTYVLIGPYTYSSAILFANVMKDYGFATLAGSGSAARRGQTGGIQSFVYPASGLELVCPRFYLLPPSSSAGLALVEPDIALHDSMVDPGQQVLELVKFIQDAPASRIEKH
nr:S41 family peptidase [Xanthomonas sp. CFBP 8151]